MRVPWVHTVTLRSAVLHVQNDAVFVYLLERSLKSIRTDAYAIVPARA
jgi:hypothetical protein